MDRANRERRIWRSIHRWLGLWLGAWFALVGLTGSVLVYEDPIDAWLNPGLLRDPGRGPWLPPHEILARAQEEFPRANIERIRLPEAPSEVYRLLVLVAPYMRIDSPRVEAMFSPATGKFLGQRDAEEHGFSAPLLLKTLYDFHRNVLLGNAGSNIVGIAGFLMLGGAISGLMTALPRRRAGWRRLVAVKLRAGATRILFDMHRSTGVLLFVLLLLATVTGSTLVYINYAREIVGVFSEVMPFPVIPWRQRTTHEWPSFEAVVTGVRKVYPEHAISEIHVPSRPTTGYLFYLRGPQDIHRLGDTIVWVDPATGETLVERSNRTRTAGEAFMHWLFPLHSGTAFGTPGKVAMCATGLAPLILVFTGLWVWSRKRRSERIELRRRASAAGDSSGFEQRHLGETG